ncbi:MAG: CHAT domain-containing tetratricopeptide repeat protein [Candidatus Eremiobacteraeota bacterium]|nr:CHAT domain-containing tetratricopeptide repeat protein [Candidatus Eremiobacteraeota bacterium]
MVKRVFLEGIILFLILAGMAPLQAGEPAGGLEKGILCLKKSQYAECRRELDGAIRIARGKKDRAAEAKALLWRARLSFELCLYDSLFRDASDAERIFTAMGNSEGIASGRILTAWYYLSKDRRAEAWKVLEEVSGLKDSSPENAADYYLLRGRLLIAREAYDMAGKNFEEASKRAAACGDRERSLLAALGAARLASAEKKFEKAHQACTTAMDDARESGRPYLAALLLQAQAEVSRAENRTDEAMVDFFSAAVMFENLGNKGKAAQVNLQLADLFQGLSRWDKATLYGRKALSLYQSSHDYYGTLISCYALISQIYTTEDKSGLEPLLAQMREASARCTDPRDRAWEKQLEGNFTAYLKNDRIASLSLYKESVDLYRACGDKRGLLKSLMAEAGVLSFLARYNQAIKLYREALALSTSLPPLPEGDDREFFHFQSPGAISAKIGDTLLMQSMYRDALEYYDKAIAFNEGDTHTFDRIQNRFGAIIVSIATYDLERAEKDIRTSLSEIKTLTKPPQRAVSYYLISTALSMSRSSQGIKGYSRFTSMKESVSGELMKKIFSDPLLREQVLSGYRDWIAYAHEKKSKLDEGMAHLFLGFFYFSGGRNDEAITYYGKARELFMQGGAPMWEQMGYIYMSQLYMEEGKKREALRLLKEAVSSKGPGLQPDMKMSFLCTMAALARDIEGPEKALHYYREALDEAKKQQNPRLVPHILVGMSNKYHEMGNYQESSRCSNEALSLLKESGSRMIAALASFYLGRDAEALGRDEEAIAFYRRAMDGFRAIGSIYDERDTVLKLGGLLEKKGSASEALALYREMIKELSDMTRRDLTGQKAGRGDAQVKELFERTLAILIKNGKYDEALSCFNLSATFDVAGNIDLVKFSKNDEKLKKLLERMQSLGSAMKTIQSDLENVDDKKRTDFLSGILAKTRQEFFAVINEIREKNPDYEQFLSMQGADLAALQPIIPQDTLLLQYYPAREALYIFLVDRARFSIRKVEVPREQLYSLVRQFREELFSRRHGAFPGKSRAHLYRYLLAPVKDEIAKKKQLEVIPGGLLWYIPFEVLGDEGKPSLIEEISVGYLYSSDITKLFGASKGASVSPSSLLAFGAPAGSDVPSSLQEVQDIGKIFSSSRIYHGSEATKERFTREAPSASIIHLATHSSLNRDDINKSYIQFSGGEGKLYLGDIYGLQVPGASIVVLSSCESALGDENPGREYASLASAFAIAGSPSVIASLWRVEDKGTALLFREFYSGLKEGLGRSEALRRAKISLMGKKDTASPFYWAGFILLGDWR